MGKGIYAARDITAGTALTLDHFVFKSPGTMLTPYDAKNIIGKKTLVDLKQDEAIQLNILTPVDTDHSREYINY
jgi:sialic acid synthase SpsE